MPDNNDRDLYKSLFDREAAKIGTSAAERNFSEELARQREATRIQRQTAGASYAEMYQRAQGQMSRGAMAGTAPGLTGGMATQRRTELEGAQMRALSSISGQREQAMRDIDYMDLMAPQRAFEFSQQQQMAQREEQMFNLQMIQSRQSILDSKMSDEDKIQALTNTGVSLADARAQVEEGTSRLQRFQQRIGGGATGALVAGGGAIALSSGTIARAVLPASTKAAIKGFMTSKGLMSATGKIGLTLGFKAALPFIGAGLLVIGSGLAIYNYYKSREQ